jgi:hypothetical protein
MKKTIWGKGALWFFCSAAVIVLAACTPAAEPTAEVVEPAFEATPPF